MPRQEGMTRAEQVAETIYALPDGSAFYTPDGEGRIWYDDVDQALEQAGDYPVVDLDRRPEDF